MYKLSEIKELIKLVDQTSIQELEIENEGTRLMIRKPNRTDSVLVAPVAHQVYSGHVPHAPQAPSPMPSSAPTPAEPAAAPAAVTETHYHKIVSPMVGTFYATPSPGAPAFVSVGDKVKEKTVVCIIEAMKLMNEIEAEIKGEIVEVLVDNGQLVEYGQPLFLVKPE